MGLYCIVDICSVGFVRYRYTYISCNLDLVHRITGEGECLDYLKPGFYFDIDSNGCF